MNLENWQAYQPFELTANEAMQTQLFQVLCQHISVKLHLFIEFVVISFFLFWVGTGKSSTFLFPIPNSIVFYYL